MPSTIIIIPLFMVRLIRRLRSRITVCCIMISYLELSSPCLSLRWKGGDAYCRYYLLRLNRWLALLRELCWRFPFIWLFEKNSRKNKWGLMLHLFFCKWTMLVYTQCYNIHKEILEEVLLCWL